MTRSRQRVVNRCRNRGIALLLMLSFLIVVITTVAIARLSLNEVLQQRQSATRQALTESRDALVAWALTSASLTAPPGTLPCPDINFDGIADKPGANCTSELGFVPYRTLGIAEPRDGDGALLWYGVSNTYARDVNVALNQLRNSSLISPLFLNNAANPIAFVLVSQNDALGGQNRGNVSVANRAQFLEGLNANNNFNDYSDVFDQTHNDQLLAVSVSAFWSFMEERVFADMTALLTQYSTVCGSYPWAVPFAVAGSAGQLNTYQGRLPVSNEWGMPCHAPQNAITAPVFQPQWLRDHWGPVFYYAMCQDATPVNPPAGSCLSLGNGATANVILVGPGSSLAGVGAGQNRAILNVTNYLENENATPMDNTFQKTSRSNHTATFNDLIKIVTP